MTRVVLMVGFPTPSANLWAGRSHWAYKVHQRRWLRYIHEAYCEARAANGRSLVWPKPPQAKVRVTIERFTPRENALDFDNFVSGCKVVLDSLWKTQLIDDDKAAALEKFDWIYHGRISIDKDPQAQAIRTKSKALLFVQLRKDASWLRPALADYILIFRAPGENAVPIQPDITNEDWIQWARPIWYGIRETDTLNTVVAKENDDERHICPLQLGTIERCIRLWTNPGELVVSPFAGIGSEGYEAVRLGRRFWGCELKPQYAKVAASNLHAATHLRTQGILFAETGA